MKRLLRVVMVALLALLALLGPVQGQEMEWVRQFGTFPIAYARGVAADALGVYVAGPTTGTFPGESSSGAVDAFLRKYDANGNLLWTRQFGTPGSDTASGVATDASGVYVVGDTQGALPEQTSFGSWDAFVRLYDTNGNHPWTRQFGTGASDDVRGVAADASGVYVAGFTYGGFPGEINFGAADAFLRKYDTSGNVLWTRQFGTSDWDAAYGLAADALGVYMAGPTTGTFPGESNAGFGDVFLRTYDTDGNHLWTRQFGTYSWDTPFGVAASATGVYVTGHTYATFPGQISAGNTDAFVAKFTVAPPDTTPPETTITSLPPNPSNSSSASFTFASSEGDSTLDCSLDGGAFAPCTSPTSYGGLADGSHTFEVQATDPAGNTDPTPASYAWTVDTTPPETTITSALDGDGAAVTSGGSTLSGAIIIEFNGTDGVTAPANLAFECSLDGAAYAPCASPQGYGGLALGNHLFQVRAADEAGNQDPTPASLTWAVVTPA